LWAYEDGVRRPARLSHFELYVEEENGKSANQKETKNHRRIVPRHLGDRVQIFSRRNCNSHFRGRL